VGGRAGIHLYKGDPSKCPQKIVPKDMGKKEKDKGQRHRRGCLPCREDLASAAISWMVRALRDLGSIATVSPTFTLNNTIRRSVSL
jgi:hypothetical protein